MTTQIKVSIRFKQAGKPDNNMMAIIKEGSVTTKYGDIGQAKNSYKGMKEANKNAKGYAIKDLTRSGVIREEFQNTTEEELVEYILKQVEDTINGYKEAGEKVDAIVDVK